MAGTTEGREVLRWLVAVATSPDPRPVESHEHGSTGKRGGSGLPTIEHMTIKKLEHVGIVVTDLDAAIDFFVQLGLEPGGKGQVGGDWVDRPTSQCDPSRQRG
jgi:hypothetical protein